MREQRRLFPAAIGASAQADAAALNQVICQTVAEEVGMHWLFVGFAFGLGMMLALLVVGVIG